MSGTIIEKQTEEPTCSIPKRRQDALKWNGWGYKDSGFIYQNGVMEFTGDRYSLGSLQLPYFTQWVIDTFGGDYSKEVKSVQEPTDDQLPATQIQQEFISDLDLGSITSSTGGSDRLFRSHGHTLHDIFNLRVGKFPRIPDIVVWPESHEHVVKVVELAKKYNIVLVPFGGGTSVTGALELNAKEERPIVSVDTSQMNKILWIDESNLICCAQSGIIGQDIETQLKARGYTTGHEPDSYEFSSLGGWIATRASGMKKNTYGNIEDLVVSVRMVSPSGVIEKYTTAPRVSAGPDIHHFIMGSEGTLGVVTEIVIKIRPLPDVQKFGSIVFPNFASGVACMREIAKERCQPSSIRLMDNEQFKFGHSLRPKAGIFGGVKESIKNFYLTKFKGFDLGRVCVATLLFEGHKDEVEGQEIKINSIASKYGGIAAGEKNGERGYTLTLVIAYIRDIALDFHIVAESFETSVPWSHTYNLCENVKLRVANECTVHSIHHYFITCRVTQTYDAGACVYFYFAFNYTGIYDPVRVFEEIETVARNEILANKGSISHHHGVGKIRQKWINETLSPAGIQGIQDLKRSLDPTDLFANGNLIPSNVLKSKL